MTRLIDANALKETIQGEWYVEPNATIFECVFNLIDKAPTVVVGYLTNCANCERVEKIIAKRPQGEWIFNTSFWSCSVCKNSAKTIGYCGDAKFMNEFFKYCPNCGAKMEVQDAKNVN